MHKIDEIEVVEVVDNEELGAVGQKDEESFVDENAEIFDTILLTETIETAKSKLKVLKDQGSDTCGVLGPFSIFSLLTRPPIASILLNGVHKIFLPMEKS